MKKIVSSLILFIFLLNTVMPAAVAEEVLLPPAQGTIALSPNYSPCQLRGVRIDPQDPFRLDFIVDVGDSGLTGPTFDEESRKLIKYFLATLTTPEKDLWVNLSPYEDNRIIQDDFGRTAMGRDLLSQDYLLKQITASLMHPDSDLGKKFWAEVYKRSFEKFGTTDIPIDTFNKVWIVPERAVIYENRDQGPTGRSLAAFVDEQRLKVMLESDYLALEKQGAGGREQGKSGLQTTASTSPSSMLPASSSQDLAKQVVREVVVPVLQKEVNEGKNFAPLRQVYSSLLLAVWLKKKLQSAVPVSGTDVKPGMVKGNILSLIFVNQHKTGGLETADPRQEVRSIYDRYVEAFRKGAYNLIREDYDLYSQELIPRKYFSGGVEFAAAEQAMEIRHELPGRSLSGLQSVAVALNGVGDAAMAGRRNPRDFTGNDGRTYRVGEDGNIRRVVDRRDLFKFFGAATATAAVASFGVSRLLQRTSDNRAAETATAELASHAGRASPQVLDSGGIERILDEVTTGMQYYQTGNSNKNSSRRFFRQLLGQGRKLNAKMSTEEALRRLSNGDPKMSFDQLARIMNKASNDFTTRLVDAGLPSYEQAGLMSGIFGRESEFDMSRGQLIGKKRKITQARGGGQFEFRPFKELLGIAQALLSEKAATSWDFKRFLAQIDAELAKRGLGDLKNNRWTSDDKKDLVVQSEAHIRLAYIWLNHLATTQPTPLMTEMRRLDQLWLMGNTSWTNKELTLLQYWEQIKPRYPQNMHTTLLKILLAAAWQGGKNLTARQFSEILKYVFSDNKGREKYLSDAGKDLRKQARAMADRNGVVKQVTLAVGNAITAKGRAKLFSRNSAARQEALIYLKGRLTGEKWQRFLSAWGRYRQLEDDLYFAGWKLKSCRMAALYADIVWSYWNANANPEKAYQLGLVFTDERVAHQEEMSKDDAQASEQDSATSYGGIDLATGKMDLSILGNAGAFQIEIPTAQLEQLKNDVTGLVPLIIKVEPLRSLPAFLGMAQGEDKMKG